MAYIFIILVLLGLFGLCWVGLVTSERSGARARAETPPAKGDASGRAPRPSALPTSAD